MIRIPINSDIIHWVSDRSGLPIDVLEKKFPNVRNWIDGSLQPTLKQVEKLAKKTNTPLGYLFLSEPVEERLPIPYFRTISDKKARIPSPELLDTVYNMQQRQEWMREFLIEQGQTPLTFVGSANTTDNYRIIATNIRNTLGLGVEWAAQHRTWTAALRAFYRCIEKAEILVVANGVVGNNTSRKLDLEEFRGFVLYDEYAPLIFINSVDGKAAQMFTLAHEIAHIWFGSSAAFDLRELQPSKNEMEQACNAVAAEVLVPENELRRIWTDTKRTIDPYQMVAHHFKVSPLVAARRALDLNLIERNDFLAFYEDYKRDEDRRQHKRSRISSS